VFKIDQRSQTDRDTLCLPVPVIDGIMTAMKPNILIVEDDASVLASLEQVFHSLGYHVCTATDGLKALAAFREQVPDILLSDLNMPGMSGFELLSVVSRRFPAVRVVAMSGAFGDAEIPFLAADAFYHKGSGIPALLKALEAPRTSDRHNRSKTDTIWVQRSETGASSEDSVMMACPECFRTFPQRAPGNPGTILDASCIHCGGSIAFAVVPTMSPLFGSPFRSRTRFASH
jgi:CheY-like chemotaxis protein